MYINNDYENLVTYVKEHKLTTIEPYIVQICTFYKSINEKFERCTARYQTAVTAILNQFPIKTSVNIDGKTVLSVEKNIISEIDVLKTFLQQYIGKFESIEYLDFLGEENRNVVFVGPNGCGKTTLLRKLKKDTSGANIQYFSADRVLLVSDHFNPKRAYDAFIKDLTEVGM